MKLDFIKSIESDNLFEWFSLFEKKNKSGPINIMKETAKYFNLEDYTVLTENLNNKYPIDEFFILWRKWINHITFIEILEKTLLSTEYNKYGLFDIECSLMKEQQVIDDSSWMDVIRTQKIKINGNTTNFIFLVLAIEQLLKEKFNKMKDIEEEEVEEEEEVNKWCPFGDF